MREGGCRREGWPSVEGPGQLVVSLGGQGLLFTALVPVSCLVAVVEGAWMCNLAPGMVPCFVGADAYGFIVTWDLGKGGGRKELGLASLAEKPRPSGLW